MVLLNRLRAVTVMVLGSKHGDPISTGKLISGGKGLKKV